MGVETYKGQFPRVHQLLTEYTEDIKYGIINRYYKLYVLSVTPFQKVYDRQSEIFSQENDPCIERINPVWNRPGWYYIKHEHHSLCWIELADGNAYLIHPEVFIARLARLNYIPLVDSCYFTLLKLYRNKMLKGVNKQIQNIILAEEAYRNDKADNRIMKLARQTNNIS